MIGATRLRDEVFDTCLDTYDKVFASGKLANNKFYMERLQEVPSVRRKVVYRLGRLAMGYDAQFVVAVPNGANWLAEEMAETFSELELVTLTKDPETLRISYKSEEDRRLCLSLVRGVLVEDVINEFTNSRKTLAFDPALAERIIAEVAVIDRGLPGARQEIGVPHDALITEYVPPIIEVGSKHWGYINHD